MAYLIEGDGLLDSFYYYLWLKASQDSGFRGFFLPDTVIYKYQQARHWFFTSNERTIKKKSSKKLTAQYIEASFLKRASKSGIVASFTYMNEGVRTIEYLGPADLKHFLHFRKKPADGVLQRFIEPPSNHEAQIQIVWTPKVSLFEHRVNHKDLFDLRYDLYERATTFEGEEYHCAIGPLKCRALERWLKHTVVSLIEHIAEVSSQKIQISRIALQFKRDALDNIWLLRASSIRCQPMNPNYPSQPLSLTAQTKVPETVNSKKLSVNPHAAMELQRTVLCRNCNQPTESNKMYEVTYRMIINADNDSGIPSLIWRIHQRIDYEEYKKFRTKHTNK